MTIRPRLAAMRRRLLQPGIVIGVLVLALGATLAIMTHSIFAVVELPFVAAFVAIVLIYLPLYYRNVSWAVRDGEIERTTIFGSRHSIPATSVRRFVRVTLTTSIGRVQTLLILGADDRCLAQMRACDEYSPADLIALAQTAGVELVDAGPMDLSELARRWPTAASRASRVGESRVAKLGAAMTPRGVLGQLVLGAVVLIAFVIYEMARR